MISARILKLIDQEVKEAQSVARYEAPSCHFIFKGADQDNIYFDLVCQMDSISAEEIRDLEQKTRFIPIEIKTSMAFRGSYRVEILKHSTVWR
jgi:hypothetical protein